MTLIPAGCSDIDVRGSDRTEMTSCITGANIKTDQWPVKRYSGRKRHSATKNNLPRACRVASSQETEERNTIPSPSSHSHLNTLVFKSSKMTCFCDRQRSTRGFNTQAGRRMQACF